MTLTNSALRHPIRLNALVILAGLLGAACASESPGGPSPVADVAATDRIRAAPAIVDLWGPGVGPHASAYASAINAAGLVVGVRGMGGGL